MIKARYIFAASAVFLAVALAVNTLSNNSEAREVSSSASTTTLPVGLRDLDVLTWDCELPVHKPDTMTLTCADGGWSVGAIVWKSWTTEGAIGQGVWRENLCEPSCSEGRNVEAKINVTLSDLTPYRGKYYLRTLDIRTPSGQDFPWGRTGVMQWDVMEFAEMMGKGE
jgi:hypothetical protein